MIRINLLPVRKIQRRQKAYREFLIGAVSVMTLFVIVGLISLQQGKMVSSLQSQITKAENEKKQFEGIVAQIKKLQDLNEGLKKRLATINDLTKKQQIPVHIVDELANTILSKQLWLESLKQSNQTITIIGVALDNATIATYMNVLNNSPFFAEVNLAESSMVNIAEQKLKRFNLSFVLKADSKEQQPVKQTKENEKK